jgi:Putative auto-transporter adhesin, head GIN domain
MRRLALAALVVVAAAGCGGGPRVTETRNVEPFDRIEVSDGIDVDVVPGAGTEVRVRAGEDVLDRVSTEARGGVLRLDLVDRGIVIGPDPLGDARVTVAAASVRGLLINGSGDVTLSGVEEDELEIEVEGSGEIDASGTVDRLTATIEGAGDANLSDLAARTAHVSVRGAGDADLNVSEQLDVEVHGAGDVTYRGAARVQSSIEGAGDLRHEGS